MEKSFASLLRHSKLATFDRRLNQVYSTAKHSKQRGDWGLKRNLPTVIRTPFVTIGQLDTIEHQTPWDSGHCQVAFIQRWKENFSNIASSSSSSRRTTYRPPHKPQIQRLDDHNFRNITSMTRSQFDHFIKHTITPDKARAFRQALQSHQLTRDQVYDYLQVTFRPAPNTVVGPIYNYPKQQQQQEVIVQGRILNTQSGGYAVGVSGVVAFLPKRYATGLKKPGDRLMVRSFYVRHAYIDGQGKPQVTVSLLPRPSTSTTLQISDMVSSPTSALPLSSAPLPSQEKWTPLEDDLFATTPFTNDMDAFLLNSQPLSTKSTITSLNEALLEYYDTKWVNRIKKTGRLE